MSVLLTIKNFQSIKELSLDISGLTVLTGPSNIGKSAIRRATNFILTNDWDKGFVRTGEKDVEISISTPELSVSRTKGKSNLTVINGVTYEKSGTTTPVEYKDYGIKPLVTVDNEYNIIVSSQLDRLFLASYSESEQHKILNSILETAKYEEALRFVNADINSTSREHTEILNKIDQVNIDIVASSNIIELLQQIEQDQLKIDQINTIVDKKSKLEKLTTWVNFFYQAINTVQQVIDIDTTIDRIEKHKWVSSVSKKAEDGLDNITSYINVSICQQAIEGYYSLSYKITLLKEIDESINLQKFLVINESIKTTGVKLEKATIINSLFDSMLLNYQSLNAINEFKTLNEKSAIVVKKLVLITDTKILSDNIITTQEFIDTRRNNDVLILEIEKSGNEIKHLTNEIKEFIVSHKHTDDICSLCGQLLPIGEIE